MSGDTFEPGELYRLRRDVHGFVSRYGRFFWAARQQHGQQLRVPPALGGLPAHQRPQALARDEARRLARSRLCFLDEAATGQAVRLGAAIRAAAHLTRVRVAGHTGVVAAVDIVPPAPRGLLRWASGVLLGPPAATPTPTPPPGAEGPRGGVANEDIARPYTLFGSWLLLTVSGLAAVRHEPTSAEITADRRAAITASRVIYGTGRSSRQLAGLIHTLIRAARTDNDEKDTPEMIFEQRGITPAGAGGGDRSPGTPSPTATTCTTAGHAHRAPAAPASYALPATTGTSPGRQPGIGRQPEPPWARLRQVQRPAARAPAVTQRGRGNAPPLPGEPTGPHRDAAAATVSEAAAVRWPRAMAAPALDVTLDDVRRAYPTWRAWPTGDGHMAQAILVPSLTVRAATAPGLLHEIEAGIDARRGGGNR